MNERSKKAPQTSGLKDAGPMKQLSAVSLKHVLWETLNEIKSDQMLPAQGDAIAAQAREILRTIKVQLQVAGQAKRQVPMDVVDFAEKSP